MKEGETMAGRKTIHRLEKKFSILQQKQEQTMAKIRQEMKRTKKEIEAQRLAVVSQVENLLDAGYELFSRRRMIHDIQRNVHD